MYQNQASCKKINFPQTDGWNPHKIDLVHDTIGHKETPMIGNGTEQGRIQPEVEGGGAICRVCAKNIMKSKRTESAKSSGPLFRKNSLGFQSKNALIYMFPTFETKHEKECIWVRVPSQVFIMKGGSCPRLHPLNPPLALNHDRTFGSLYHIN